MDRNPRDSYMWSRRSVFAVRHRRKIKKVRRLYIYALFSSRSVLFCLSIFPAPMGVVVDAYCGIRWYGHVGRIIMCAKWVARYPFVLTRIVILVDVWRYSRHNFCWSLYGCFRTIVRCPGSGNSDDTEIEDTCHNNGPLYIFHRILLSFAFERV